MYDTYLLTFFMQTFSLSFLPGRIFVDHILLRTKSAGFWCVEFYLVGRFAVVGLLYTHPLPNENNFYI